MVRSSLLSVALLLAVPVAGFAAPDSAWPGYLGPTRDGRAASRGGELAGAADIRFETLWRRPLGSGYSGIAVADGRAFTMYSDGTSDLLEAMDATTGKRLWARPIGAMFKGYSGAADGPTGTPTLAGNVVYALGPRGQMLAAEVASGKLLWQQDLVEELGATTPTWGVSSSPLVVGETVVVLVGGGRSGTVCALGRNDGRVVWCSGEAEVGYQSPTLLRMLGGEQLVVASNTYLYGIEPASGELRWSLLYEPVGGQGSGHPVMVGEDRILIEAEAGFSLFRLYPAGRSVVAKKVWQNGRFKDSFAVPLAHAGELYGYRGGIFVCLDATTGELNWQSRAPGEGEAILIDDRIVTWGKDGRLRVVEPDPTGYREIASHPALARGSFATPAYAAGVLYVRNLEEIAAVRIAPAAD